MKITNDAISQTSLTPAQQTTGPETVARDSPVDGATKSNDGYTPSAEWLHLVDQVRQEPEVRADRVREVFERLQNGDYFSLDAAAKTADAILRSFD